MLSIVDLPENEAVYTFVDDETGEPTHIAASTLRRLLDVSPLKPTDCMMGAALVQAILRGDLNQEEDHALKLPDEALEVPLIVGVWGTTISLSTARTGYGVATSGATGISWLM